MAAKSIVEFVTSIFNIKLEGEGFTDHLICTLYHEDMSGHGIFSSHDKFNPLTSGFPLFMLQVIMSLLLCKLLYFALGPWIGSKLVCNVLGGVILGPSIMGQIDKKYMESIFPENEMYVLNTLVKVGTGYYLFLAGAKMDTAMLLRTAKNSWIIGISSFLVPVIFALYFCLTLHKNVFSGFFIDSGIPVISNALAVTFYANIASAMEEHDLLTTELGQLSLSAAMLMESIGWFHTCISVILVQANIYDKIRVFILLCAFILSAIYIIRPTIKKINKRTPEGSPVSENYVIAILVSALVMGLIAEVSFGAFNLGALLMGLVIPDGPPLGSALVEKAELMVMEFFQPMFFLLIGYNVDVSLILHSEDVALLLLFIVGCHLAKILGTMIATLFVNINLRNAVLLALILNMRGFVDLTAYEKWLMKGVMDRRMFTTLVLANVFLTAIYNAFLDIFYQPQIRLAQFTSSENYFRTLQSTPSHQELRILTCIHSEDNVHSIIAFLEATYPTATSHLNVNVIHAVELAGRAGPKITPYNSNNHSRRFQSNTTKHIMRAFSNYSRNSCGPVSIRPFLMVAPFKTMHNIVCNYAEDQRIPMIIVPFLGEHDLESNGDKVRDFNAHRLQQNSPCTVGILVDRGLHSRINLGRFSYSVLVIFLGGADDCEALKLATRMSGNPDVSVTILKVKLKQDKEDINEAEQEVDNLLIQEFEDKNGNNACAVCHDLVVDKTSELLSMVECLEDSYDLVIVGKVPTTLKFVKEMGQWIDHPELGVIGDALVSSKPLDCKMSILVMQHTLRRIDKTISICKQEPLQEVKR